MELLLFFPAGYWIITYACPWLSHNITFIKKVNNDEVFIDEGVEMLKERVWQFLARAEKAEVVQGGMQDVTQNPASGPWAPLGKEYLWIFL